MTDKTLSCLKPTRFIDHNTSSVIDFAHSAIGKAKTDIDQAINLYYAVRDQIRYDPYSIVLEQEHLTASATVRKGIGFCVTKSILMAAVARVARIPSRLGYANVRNHLTTERLKQKMKTDVFVFHGYTELLLDGIWVKATPIFNLSLCERFGVKPLEFDGCHDSVFHEFDSDGNRHMEYLHDYGHFSDLPYEIMVAELQKHYPHMYGNNCAEVRGDFASEAQQQHKQ